MANMHTWLGGIDFSIMLKYQIKQIKHLRIHNYTGSIKTVNSALDQTENVLKLNYTTLANSGNTKCRPFQANINHSKSIIDRLQQRFHVTFLIYLFGTSRNLLFGVFLPRKIITILRKIASNFRQVSLKDALLSVSVLECFSKIF